MNINILRFSFFGIAGGQEVDHTFVKFIIYPFTMIGLIGIIVKIVVQWCFCNLKN